MRTFGEAGTVRTGKDGKVGNLGVTMMMVGYAYNHEGNCCRMFKPLRNSIAELRNVTWLRRMYYPRLNAGVTGFDPPIVIEAGFPREEAVEPCVKIEEVKEGDDESIRSEVSRASSSLKQEVCRSGRCVTLQLAIP